MENSTTNSPGFMSILRSKAMLSIIIFLMTFLMLSVRASAQNCSVNAGAGYAVCPSSNSPFILDGNASQPFQGTSVQWSIVTQPATSNISIVNPTQLSTSTTVATVPGSYVFKLQITCGDGSVISQNATYTVNAGAPTPAAISSTNTTPYCIATDGTSTIVFSGNAAPAAGNTTSWTYTSNLFYGTFDNASSDNPVFTIASIDKYRCPDTGSITFTRTFTNTVTGCRSSVSRTFSQIIPNIPVDAYASLCYGIGLSGTCPGAGIGTWTVDSTSPSTPVTFSNTTGNATSITNPTSGTTYYIKYTVTNSGCTNGSKQVAFTYSPAPSGSGTYPNAGPNQSYSNALPAMVTLNGNQPGAGETGMWSQITGPTANIANPTSAVTTASGLINGKTYTFRWTITRVGGCSSYDDVVYKGPILLTPTNGGNVCITNGPTNPPKVNLVTLNNFPFGVVDSINLQMTLLSAPDGIGTINTPLSYAINGSNACGANGCSQDTGVISVANPVDNFRGIPSQSVPNNVANAAVTNYSYTAYFYPKVLGTYVFKYQYSVNGGPVQVGNVTIKVSRNFAPNAGTDAVLACNALSTTLIGNSIVFNNTTDTANLITYSPVYNGQWSTVLKPTGAADPINAGNQYLQYAPISGLVNGTYIFRLTPKSNLEVTNCGNNEATVSIYVAGAAPTSQVLAPITSCNSGSIQLNMPETGYYPKGWAMVSGPTSATFSPSAQSRNATANGLVAGNYVFSFTDSSKCGNAISTLNVSIGANNITQPTITCSYTQATTTLTLNATKPNYANGETAEFIRLVHGTQITPFANGGNSALYNNRPIAGAISPGTDTIVNISNFNSSTSVSSAIVVVYKISKAGCASTSDTLVFSLFNSAATNINRTDELCNKTFPFTYTPIPTSVIPLTGNGPGNNEWMQELNAQWTVISGPNGAIAPTVASQGNINSALTFYTPGSYIVRATYPESSAYSDCGTGTFGTNYSTIVIKVGDTAGGPAYAGSDQVLCAPGTAVTIGATPSAGAWSIVSFNNAPAPVITPTGGGNATVTFITGGDAQLQWTPTPIYGWCALSNYDVVKISYLSIPVIEGPSVIDLCTVPVNYNISYNAPGSSLITASFTQVSGPSTATITTNGLESATLNGLATGSYIFKYSFSSADCGTKDTTIQLNIGTCLSINGHLWFDNNGNAINNGEMNTNLAGTMWAYLTDQDNNIIAQTKIDTTGYYAFNGVLSGGSYKVVIGQGELNATSVTSTTLPTGYASTGVNISGTANMTNQTGIIALGTITSSVTNLDFGINRLPESAVNTQTVGPNPGGTNTATVNPIWFQSTNVGTNPNTLDYDGGIVSNIRITAFPSNATSITIGTTTYYTDAGSIPGSCTGTCLAWPLNGVTVPYTDGAGPSQTIQVDPIDGVITVSIPFTAIDNAGKEDPTPGSVTLIFTTPLAIWGDFFAVSKGDHVLLQWNINDEQSMNHYDVEFSTEGKTFTAIGQVLATGNHSYSLKHSDPKNGLNYYRLKMSTNADESIYSAVRTVIIGTQNTSVSFYPNPTSNTLNISLSGSMLNKAVTFTVVGIDGKILIHKSIVRANATEKIETRSLAPGKYIVHVITDTEDIKTSIVIVR